MKKLQLLVLLLAVAMVGCKTQKIAPKPKPVVKETVKPQAPATPAKEVKNVSSREERVTAAAGENADYGSNRFFIIFGSFSVMENAQRLKSTLAAENFKPGILMNDSGMYRVCGNSFADESAARAKIAEVREKFPQYSDIWLLIKKQ